MIRVIQNLGSEPRDSNLLHRMMGELSDHRSPWTQLLMQQPETRHLSYPSLEAFVEAFKNRHTPVSRGFTKACAKSLGNGPTLPPTRGRRVR